MNLIPEQPANCPTCATKFEGPFCYTCGEKQTSPKDYTLKKYAAQAVDIFTHFDGKFFRTLKYLLFFPGKLTEENLAGRKVKLMKPVQLFVVISLVYFFLMKKIDVFVSFLGDANTESAIRTSAERIAKERNIAFEDYQEHYDKELAATAKTYTFILIPFFAVGAWLFFVRRIKPFVPHLIFATHFFSFFLAFVFLYFELILRWLDPRQLSYGQKLLGVAVGILVLTVYLFFALKRVYKQRVMITAVKTLALTIWMLVILGCYREAMAWMTFLFA